jgi:ribonuclease HII
MSVAEKKPYPNFKLERTFWKKEQIVAGVDEAGRGALAGPVVAAAVIFRNNSLADIGINDSKVLKPETREQLFDVIVANALDFSVELVDNNRIDEINILNATFEAMNQAVGRLKVKPDHLLIDGNRFRGAYIPFSTIIGGDGKSVSIAAASIIAKVTRDRYMVNVAHSEFPDYLFNQNKGYGTKQHFEMIEKNGICQLHRLSFLSKRMTKQLELF